VLVPLIDPGGLECPNQQGQNTCSQYSNPGAYCNGNYNYKGKNYCTPTCFSHNSLISLWDGQQTQNGWKYYLPPGKDFDKKGRGVGIWNGPVSISGLCLPLNGACGSTEYQADMIFETATNMKPFLDDVNDCNLAPISWVIPDARWSDHAGEGNDSGPSWVASIVNAVGNPTGNCNYWGTASNTKFGHSIAIIVTWDDWGGWWDHVNPSINASGQQFPGVNQTPNTWGAFDTYGFRVPMLVVSPFTAAGTVSGACGALPLSSCPNQNFPYVHDFGSILNLIEQNFGLTPGGIAPSGQGWADAHAPDYSTNPPNIPLQEFFETNGTSTWRSFTPITPNSSYPPSYFQNGGTLDGPDAD
jgi:hypothetical protein